MRGGLFAGIFFIIGLLLGPYVPAAAEQRLALTDTQDTDYALSERVSFDDIKVYQDNVRIEHPNLRYAKVISNSMAPFITDKSVVFEEVPKSASDIYVGDIISFYEPSEDAIILHSVIERIEDGGKTYFKTKGFANPHEDPWLVSFENVKGIMVGTFR